MKAAKPAISTGRPNRLIRAEAELAAFARELGKALREEPRFAFDWETEFDQHRHQRTGVLMAVYHPKTGAASFPVGFVHDEPQLTIDQLWVALEPFFGSTKIGKVTQNGNFDWQVWRAHGREVAYSPLDFDTLIASWLVDPDPPHDLGSLAEKYSLSVQKAFPSAKELLRTFKVKRMGEVPVEPCAFYCEKDCEATWGLVEPFRELLEKLQLADIFRWEMGFRPVIDIGMEWCGAPIDRTHTKQLVGHYARQVKLWEKKIYQAAGEPFNLNSPQQLAHVLYVKRGLQPTGEDGQTKLTPKGAPSTAEEVVDYLAQQGDAVAKAILEYRNRYKMLSTYLEPMFEFSALTGHLHANFGQTTTVTGRFSSCVAGSTLLPTSRGTFRFDCYLPQVGDRVLTHRGRWRRVLRKVYKGRAPMFRVSLTNGASVVCSAAHRLLTLTGWKVVSELALGEEVVSYVGFGALSCRSGKGGGGFERLLLAAQTDHSDAGCPVEDDAAQRRRSSETLCAAGAAEVRAGSALLAFEDGEEEPDVGQEWFPAPQLHRRRQDERGLPAKESSGTLRTSASFGDGSTSWNFGDSGLARGSPHRRGQRKQRSEQPRLGDARRASGASRQTAAIVEIAPLGTLGVWDIEVEGDHSYACQGFFHHNSQPNLQNIPKTRSDLGGDRSIRTCFRAPKGYSYFAVDLSQIELRVLAHLSQDPVMMKVYREGGDIHAQTAQEVFGEVISETRDKAKCFHPDTEVLTRTGWKRILDLAPGEEIVQAVPGLHGTVALEWVAPTEVTARKNPHGFLVHLQNEGMNLRVTPDHRMLAWRQRGSWFVDTPEAFQSKARLWANAGVLADAEDPLFALPEHLLRLAIALQADGSVRKDGAVTFGFVKDRKVRRMEALLQGFLYTRSVRVQKDANGPVTTFYVSGKVACPFVSLLEKGKRLPWSWLALPARLRGVVLEEAEFWDSWGGPRSYRYGSVVMQNVDVLQALAALTGRKTRRTQGPPGFYNLTVRSRATSRAGNLTTSRIPYSGKIACLSVPSTFVLVRDGGVPVICGQTINFGIVYGMGPNRLSKQLKVEVLQAQRFLNRFFATYRHVVFYQQDTAAYAVRFGFVRTLGGRLRWIHGLDSVDRGVQSHARNTAANTPIQGGVADLIKLAMKEIHDHLLPQYGGGAAFLGTLASGKRPKAILPMQVHDELVGVAHNSVVKKVTRQVREAMLDVIQPLLTVPVDASAKYGPSWADCK